MRVFAWPGWYARFMTETQLLDRVRHLREEGRSPKEIARALGLSPATVTPLVCRLAQERPAPPVPAAPTLVGCWVSAGWRRGLSVDGHPDWPGQSGGRPEGGGMVGVLVARERRAGKVSVCGYLVDTYCLGVKNALGPRNFDDWELPGFVQEFFDAFDGDAVPAPLGLAQHLVFGAVEYARGLGFNAHPDFRAAIGHLGTWQGPSAITFGDNGKPSYIEGPWDDSPRILRTLERSVGKGNFHFLFGLR
jgi:hypothetical protein